MRQVAERLAINVEIFSNRRTAPTIEALVAWVLEKQVESHQNGIAGTDNASVGILDAFSHSAQGSGRLAKAPTRGRIDGG
jgi:hypothetical protein